MIMQQELNRGFHIVTLTQNSWGNLTDSQLCLWNLPECLYCLLWL